MNIAYYLLTAVSFLCTSILIIYLTGYQDIVIEFLRDELKNLGGPLVVSTGPRKRKKYGNPLQKRFLNLTKTEKIFILTTLALAASISLTMLALVIFGNDNVIFIIIGAASSLFQSIMIFITFLLDKI